MVTADELVSAFGRLRDTLASVYLYLLDQSSLKYIKYWNARSDDDHMKVP